MPVFGQRMTSLSHASCFCSAFALGSFAIFARGIGLSEFLPRLLSYECDPSKSCSSDFPVLILFLFLVYAIEDNAHLKDYIATKALPVVKYEKIPLGNGYGMLFDFLLQPALMNFFFRSHGSCPIPTWFRYSGH